MVDYIFVYFFVVIMLNGVVYIDKSVSMGGWYSGDMCEVIGKVMVFMGINNVNVGIVSSVGYL